MRGTTLAARIIAPCFLAIGACAGSVWAATPSQTDMESCNKQAAEVSLRTRKGGPNEANPTGGRLTDSSQPGTSPSALGMAPAGETDQIYRQAYLVCLNQRAK